MKQRTLSMVDEYDCSNETRKNMALNGSNEILNQKHTSCMRERAIGVTTSGVTHPLEID